MITWFACLFYVIGRILLCFASIFDNDAVKVWLAADEAQTSELQRRMQERSRL